MVVVRDVEDGYAKPVGSRNELPSARYGDPVGSKNPWMPDLFREGLAVQNHVPLENRVGEDGLIHVRDHGRRKAAVCPLLLEGGGPGRIRQGLFEKPLGQAECLPRNGLILRGRLHPQRRIQIIMRSRGSGTLLLTECLRRRFYDNHPLGSRTGRGQQQKGCKQDMQTARTHRPNPGAKVSVCLKAKRGVGGSCEQPAAESTWERDAKKPGRQHTRHRPGMQEPRHDRQRQSPLRLSYRSTLIRE